MREEWEYVTPLTNAEQIEEFADHIRILERQKNFEGALRYSANTVRSSWSQPQLRAAALSAFENLVDQTIPARGLEITFKFAQCAARSQSPTAEKDLDQIIATKIAAKLDPARLELLRRKSCDEPTPVAA